MMGGAARGGHISKRLTWKFHRQSQRSDCKAR